MANQSAAVETLRDMIRKSHNIIFFGGAGMSTASGIPDFRGAHGLYQAAEGKSYEEMLSIRFFLNQPDVFWAFYRNVMLHPEAKPNAGHEALVRLERQGQLKTVITQNIDGLHQAAGSQRVLELHGTVQRNHCMSCGRVYTLREVLAADGAPHCDCGGTVRPDIVFYGEPLNNSVMDAAIRALEACDLLIVGGTSLTVYPAAGLLGFRNQAALILINREETPYDQRANLIVRDDLALALDAAIPRSTSP